MYDGILGLSPSDDSSGPLFIDALYKDDKIQNKQFAILPGSITEDHSPKITFGGYQKEEITLPDNQLFYKEDLNTIVAHRVSGSFHWELDIMNLFIGESNFRPTQRSVLMDTGTSMIMIY